MTSLSDINWFFACFGDFRGAETEILYKGGGYKLPEFAMFTLLDDFAGHNVLPLPTDTSHLNFERDLDACICSDDIAIVVALTPRITAQFKINAATIKRA